VFRIWIRILYAPRIWIPGLQIRSIFCWIRKIIILKTGSGSYWHSPIINSNIKFFSHKSDFFWYLNDVSFSWKNGKLHLKICKNSIFKIVCPFLYIAREPIGSGSGENFSDPVPTVSEILQLLSQIQVLITYRYRPVYDY